MDYFRTNKGIALASTLLIMSIMVSIVIVLLSIFLPRIDVFRQFRESQNAFYAAESAAERCVYKERRTTIHDPPYPQPQEPMVFSNGSTYLLTPDCSVVTFGTPKQARGNYRDSSFVLQIETHIGLPL